MSVVNIKKKQFESESDRVMKSIGNSDCLDDAIRSCRALMSDAVESSGGKWSPMADYALTVALGGMTAFALNNATSMLITKD